MKSKMLRVVVLTSLLLMAADASAQTYKWQPYSADSYGICGDGLWERPPVSSSFIDESKSAEQCDSGTYMLGKTSVPLKEGQVQGCYFDSQSKGCRLRLANSVNGVIEYYQGRWEECDEGKDTMTCQGGKLVGSTDYFKFQNGNLCGNGVIDPKEKCDAGQDPHNVGACKNNCQDFNEKLNGYTCRQAEVLCGNEVVDPNTGEQCDLGDQNGAPGSKCSALCTLTNSNPYFTDFLFYPYDGYKGNLDYGLWPVTGSPPLDPVDHYGTPWFWDITRQATGTWLYDRGRVVQINRDREKQFSGIMMTDRNGPLSDGEVVDINFVMRSQNGYENFDNDWFGLVLGPNGAQPVQSGGGANYLLLAWRSQHWNGYGDNANVSPKAALNPCPPYGVYAGDQTGLRLYSISGTPSYDELWQMGNCGDSKHIIEIPTQVYQGGIKSLGGTAPAGTDADKMRDYNSQWKDRMDSEFWSALQHGEKWNNIVNPAYRLSPFYYKTILNGVYPWANNAVQVRVLYSKASLKVFVNRQLVMDIDGEKVGEILGRIKGANGAGRAWPDSAAWGFYFLGMDNFIADFRSPEHRLLAPQDKWTDNNWAEALNDPTGTRCEYCGDGKVNGLEACDGGVDGVEGCVTELLAESLDKACKPAEGWACSYKDGGTGTVCYGGVIESPEAAEIFGTTTPDISGKYYGDAGEITVKITDGGSGSVVPGCDSLPTTLGEVDGEKEWSVDWVASTSCSLQRGKNYKAQLVIAPPASIGSGDVSVLFESPEVPFEISLASNVTLTIKKPGKYVGVAKGDPSEPVVASGECSGTGPLDVKLNGNLVPGCSGVSCSSSGEWSCDIPRGSLMSNAENTITVEDSSSVKRSRTFFYDSGEPKNAPTIEYNGRPLNSDETIGAQGGKLHLTGEADPWVKGSASPETVTVTIKNKTQSTLPPSEKTVPVANSGKYEVTLPLPAGSKPGDVYTITAAVKDKAGNGPAETEVTDIHVVEGDVSPYITFVPAANGEQLTGVKKPAPGESTEIQIKVGPQHPTDGDEVKYNVCSAADSTCVPGCLCSGIVVCAGARANYNPKSGICTLTFTSPPAAGQAIQVSAQATVGSGTVGPKTAKYVFDGRGSLAGYEPVISFGDVPVGAGGVDPGDDGHLTIKVTGLKNNSGGTKPLIPGDEVTVSVNGVTKSCTVSAGQTECSASFPVNNPDALLTKDGKLDTTASVVSPLGSKSEEAKEVKELLPFLTISTPLNGADITEGESIGGTYDCTGFSSTSCFASVRGLLFCPKGASKVPPCEKVDISRSDSGMYKEKGRWKATVPSGRLSDGDEYDVFPARVNGSGVAVAYPGITATYVSGKPIITSPCLAGSPGCDATKNTQGDAIHVEATGPNDAPAQVTVIDKDGNEVGTVPGSCDIFDNSGHLSCNVTLSPDQKTKGPFVVKVVSNQKEATTPPINIFDPTKPVILSPCRTGMPGCVADNNSTPEGDIHIDVAGPPGAGVKVEVTDKDGRVKTVIKCTDLSGNPPVPTEVDCTYGSDGHFVKDVTPVDDNGEPMVGPFVIKATTTKDANNQPVCSSTNADKCVAEIGPINIFDPEAPVIVSPCRIGAPACNVANNTTGATPNEINIVATGVPGHKADVIVEDKEGKKLDVSCSSDMFNTYGKLTCTAPIEGSSPYVVTVKDTTNGKEASAGPLSIPDSDTPVIISPCIKGRPACVPAENTTGKTPNEIHIVATGVPGHNAEVTVIGSGGESSHIDTSKCSKSFDARGFLVCDVDPGSVPGPYTIKVEDTDNGKSASVFIDPFKPIITSPCTKGSEGCPNSGVKDASTPGYDVIHIEAEGPRAQGAKVTVEADGNEVRTTCPSQYALSGTLACDVTVPKGKEIKVTVTTQGNGNPESWVIVGSNGQVDDSNSGRPGAAQPSVSVGGGIVAGGCGCSSSNAGANGLVSLLLALLGITFIRRRKE